VRVEEQADTQGTDLEEVGEGEANDHAILRSHVNMEDEDLAGKDAELQIEVVANEPERLRDAQRQLQEVARWNGPADAQHLAAKCLVLSQLTVAGAQGSAKPCTR
jgi:hypothetical protein